MIKAPSGICRDFHPTRGDLPPGRVKMAKTDEYPPEERACAPARILIVEDNPLNRLLIHDVLELRGHEVMEAATVEEARRGAGRRASRICCCWTCRFRAAVARP